MGFCLLNNVAVTAARAAATAASGCSIVDWDAHHGNGTQDMFYADPDVLYVSMHEWPLYPGTGRLDEIGTGAGAGTTVNFPLPAGTTGDVYLDALDKVVAPIAEQFRPDLGARLGRLRRPPGRPADRPRALGRRLRRPHRPGRSRWPRPGASSRSSRAATTSTPCAFGRGDRRRPWSAASCGRKPPRPAAPGGRSSEPSGGPARTASPEPRPGINAI